MENLQKNDTIRMFKTFPEKLEHVSSTQQYEENPMISEKVKKQQVPKEDDRSAIPVFKLSHLYLINSLLMHSNWSHCLQEVFNSGKLAEIFIPSEFQKHCFSLENYLKMYTLEDVQNSADTT